MVLVAPTLVVKMSIPSNAIESAWPEPDLRWPTGEHDDVLEFMHTQVFGRVIRECNIVMHPCNAKIVSESMRMGAQFRKQQFLNIRGLKRNYLGNGVLNIEFEVYLPPRLKTMSDEDLHTWFLHKYVQPLRTYCADWAQQEGTGHYDDWLQKVYGQLGETFRMMFEGHGLFVNISVRKK